VLGKHFFFQVRQGGLKTRPFLSVVGLQQGYVCPEPGKGLVIKSDSSVAPFSRVTDTAWLRKFFYGRIKKPRPG
jgi:hypothetical protein